MGEHRGGQRTPNGARQSDDRRDGASPYPAPSHAIPPRHAAPQGSRPRKHMGVATSDPEYLPPVPQCDENAHARAARTSRASAGNPDINRGGRQMADGSTRVPASAGQGERTPLTGRTVAPRPSNAATDAPGTHSQVNYGRYLSMPKKGRTIFTSRYERQRKRTTRLLAALIVAVALALIWFFFLR